MLKTTSKSKYILCKEAIGNIGESAIQVVGEEMSPKFCSFIQ